jgi:hypothetical protein
MRVVFPAPDRPGSAEHAIERTGGPDTKARHAARQRALVGRLDDCVDVIGLDGELNDPEFVAGCASDGGSECGEHARRAE